MAVHIKKATTHAAIRCFCVAIFHAIETFSPTWNIYFGAPAEGVAKPLLLLVLGEACVGIFASFGLYTLSGAGIFDLCRCNDWESL